MSATKKNNYHSLVKYIEDNQSRFYLLAFSYVKNRETALDMVQEAVYKALKSADHLKEPAYIKTAFAVFIGAFGIGVTTNQAFAATMSDVPILGSLVKVFTAKEVHENDDVSVKQLRK